MAAVGGSSSATRVDWYQVLGVGRGATAREISLAYRALALKFHPDKQGSAPHAHTHSDKNTQSPEEMFKRISEANEVLSDPARRAEYDEAPRSDEARCAIATALTDAQIKRPWLTFFTC